MLAARCCNCALVCCQACAYAASLAQAGRMDEARAMLERIKEMHPALSVAWIEQNVPYTPGPMAKFLEGMHKAGLE